MNTTIAIVVAAAVLGAVFFLYKPERAAVAVPQSPTLPATQDPRAANAFCQGVVSTASTAAATYYGGAAGGAAAQKTGASAGLGIGVCAAVKKAEDVQLTAANYIAKNLPGGIGDPFKTATTSAITSANPFHVAEHPVDAAKEVLGGIKNTATSVVHTISSWF